MPTSSDPADGSFLPSERDPTGFIAGGGRINRSAVRSEQATGRREGKGGEGEGELEGGWWQERGRGGAAKEAVGVGWQEGREQDAISGQPGSASRTTAGPFFPQL